MSEVENVALILCYVTAEAFDLAQLVSEVLAGFRLIARVEARVSSSARSEWCGSYPCALQDLPDRRN